MGRRFAKAVCAGDTEIGGVVAVYVSLKDVAARAGVSFQTASKVLNGNRAVVSAATRDRILAAAQDLGYVPNVLARGLISRSTVTVGVIADDLGDWVLAQIVAAGEREALGQGHEVLISTAHRGSGGFQRSVRHLLERRVAGILVAAPGPEDTDGYGEALRGPVPAVSVHQVPGGGVPVVGPDHVETGRLAAEHLLGLGHRRVATVVAVPGRRVAASRLQGFRGGLAAAGVELPDSRVVSTSRTEYDGYTATLALLERDPEITAIFAQTDLLATGTLAALARAGRRVPADCAVIGCDDIPAAAFLNPALSTVAVPIEDIGRRAMDLLLTQVAGGADSGTDRSVLLPVRVIGRESTLGAGVPLVAAGRAPPGPGGGRTLTRSP